MESLHACASQNTCLRNAGPEGDTEGGDLNAREGRLLDALVSTVQVSALPIWILGGLVTASGRILADVHWYDSMAFVAIQTVERGWV